MVHWYTVPPLISALAMFSLGIVSVFSMKRERLWRVFAIFCFLWMGISILALLLSLSEDPETVKRLSQLGPAVAFLTIGLANYYAFLLMDPGDRTQVFAKSRLKPNLFISWLIVVVVGLIVLLVTGQLVADVRVDEAGAYRVSYGPFMYVVLFLFFGGTIKNTVFFALAFRGSDDRNFRQFVLLNMIAFHMIFAPVLLLAFVLPLLGVQSEQFTFLTFPFAVMVFYIAIVRYQFAQVDELNLSLERRVEERTAELKQAQSKLIQSEKIASMGRLVAGIAHEVNNPLGAVRSMAQSSKLAVSKLKSTVEDPDNADGEKLNRLFDAMDNANRVIEDGTRKVAEVVETLRNFANLDEADLQLFDVHEGLEDSLKILQHEFKPTVRVTRQYGQVQRIRCFPAQLNQVFLNILTNANEAITDVGEITISTYVLGNDVCVTIKDTGRGIPDENKGKIFDPGFTTKGVGVGTGLGLAICYRIVHDHNGDIEVESEEGKGTAVTIVLPTDSRPGTAE